MTALWKKYDAFPFCGADARHLDQWCDEFEVAVRSGRTQSFPDWLQRLPESLRTPALEYLLEIDLNVSIERNVACRSLSDYQRVLPDFAEDLATIWPSLGPTVRSDPPPTTGLGICWPERFRMIEKLGEGGMGEVYLIEHRLLGRLIAAKVLRRRLDQNERAVERFRREIRTLASLKHHGIATAVDADLIDGHLVLLMEFVAGSTLQDVVRAHGPLPWIDAVKYCCELAKTLSYTHDRGVIHRDVKPGNVMLDTEGRIRLLDLGLARVTNESIQPDIDSQYPTFSGTPDFAAPEQQICNQPDPRSDIYGLGSTLYFLIHGSVMYPAPHVAEKLRLHREGERPKLTGPEGNIPEELEKLFHRMVAQEPTDRPTKMSDVERDLQRVIDVNQRENSPPLSTRRNWLQKGALIAVSAIALPLIGKYWRKSNERETLRNSIGMELVSLGRGEHPPSIAKRQPVDEKELLWTHDLVSVKQFSEVMGLSVEGSSDKPMTGVDWMAANEFCRRLSALPAEKRYGRRYRLPSEAEWETVSEMVQRENEQAELAFGTTDLKRDSRHRWAKSMSKQAIWSWCADSLMVRVGPRSISNIAAKDRISAHPLRGGTGLFIHNFDLFMGIAEHRIQMENIEVTEESDGRTRYYAPTRLNENCFVIYRYELPEAIESSKVFASILVHGNHSEAQLAVSADGKVWQVIDDGYVVKSSDAPRDVTSILEGSTQAFIRLSLRQESGPLNFAQALRTSPEPHLQFPHVYEFQADLKPGIATTASRLTAPGSLKHRRVGLRVVCDF